MNRQRLTLVGLVLAAASLLLVGRGLSALLVDRAWFAALGAESLWREQVLATLVLKGAGWLLGSAFAFANLWAVRLTIESIAVPTRVANLELVEVLPARRLFIVTLLAAVAVGVLLTLPLDDWTLLSAAWRGEPYLEYEAFLRRDLGFYVHWLPFESALYTWALITIVVVTFLVTLLYALTRSLRFEGRTLIANAHVRRHLTTLGALVLLLLSWSYRLDAYDLLLWGSGPDGLFTAIDHRFTTRVDVGLALATFAAALVVLRTGWIGQMRAAFITVTLVLVGALGVRQLGPTVVERGGLMAVSAVRAADYEATRALFTRRAWAVDEMPVDEPDGGRQWLSGQEAQAIRTVSLWDAGALQRVRPLLEPGVSVVTAPVWQAGPDAPEAIVVTRSVAVTPVWDVRLIAGAGTDSRGAPALARHPALRGIALAEPIVAPGLSGHRLVDASVAGDVTGSGPSGGAANSSAPAEGHLSASDPFADRSVPAARLRAPLSRLAHAWATRDAALLASDSLGTGTAVALHLDVRDRVRRLTPAFAQGSAVTPILYDTRLLWAVDLYAASDRYPLSHRFLAAGAVRSSLRHAATALVDAQTGAVKLVRRGGADALARTWLSLLPDLVLEVGDLPAVLQARLPIPTDGALATARAFSRVGSRRTGHTARYTPDSLPGPDPFPVALGPDGSIGWSVPLVDDADQVVGMLRASGGADGGPRWQPLSAPTPRWSALSSALSRQLDSLMAAQSESRDGPLRAAAPRVLTLDGRAWLLRPAYAEEDGQWRAIGVAVASDTTAFVLPIHGGVPLRSERTRIEEAQRHYDTLRDALRQSDWLRVGAALDSLGRSLDRQP